MGDLTLSRKRGEETFLSSPKFSKHSYDHIAKKPKLSKSMNQKTPDYRTPFFCSVVSRISQYPSAKNSGFPRDPHALIRNSRLGRSSLDKGTEATPISTGNQADEMGYFGFFSRWIRHKWARKEAMNTIGNKVLGKQKDKEVIEIDSEDVCDDSSIEEPENLHSVKNSQKLNARKVKKEERSLDSSVVSDVRNAIAKEDVVENAQLSLLDQEPNDSGELTYKRLWEKTQKPNPMLADLEASIERELKILQFCHLSRPQKKEVKKDVASECFVPLTKDEKELVSQKLSNAYRRKIVVSHESSNIDTTGEKLQCLMSKAWLNDELISEDENQDDVCDDSSIKVLKNLHSGEKRRPAENSRELNAKKVKKDKLSLDSSIVSDVCNATEKVDGGEKTRLLLLDQEKHDSGVPAYKRLLLGSGKAHSKLANLDFALELDEKHLQWCHLSRPQQKKLISEDENQDDVCDDSSIVELENLRSVENVWGDKQGPAENSQELNATKVKKDGMLLDSSVVSDVHNATEKVDDGGKARSSLLDQEPDDSGMPMNKRLSLDSGKPDNKLVNLDFALEIEEKCLQRPPPPLPVEDGHAAAKEVSGGRAAKGQKYRLPDLNYSAEDDCGGAVEGQKYSLPDLNASPPSS